MVRKRMSREEVVSELKGGQDILPEVSKYPNREATFRDRDSDFNIVKKFEGFFDGVDALRDAQLKAEARELQIKNASRATGIPPRVLRVSGAMSDPGTIAPTAPSAPPPPTPPTASVYGLPPTRSEPTIYPMVDSTTSPHAPPPPSIAIPTGASSSSTPDMMQIIQQLREKKEWRQRARTAGYGTFFPPPPPPPAVVIPTGASSSGAVPPQLGDMIAQLREEEERRRKQQEKGMAKLLKQLKDKPLTSDTVDTIMSATQPPPRERSRSPPQPASATAPEPAPATVPAIATREKSRSPPRGKTDEEKAREIKEMRKAMEKEEEEEKETPVQRKVHELLSLTDEAIEKAKTTHFLTDEEVKQLYKILHDIISKMELKANKELNLKSLKPYQFKKTLQKVINDFIVNRNKEETGERSKSSTSPRGRVKKTKKGKKEQSPENEIVAPEQHAKRVVEGWEPIEPQEKKMPKPKEKVIPKTKKPSGEVVAPEVEKIEQKISKSGASASGAATRSSTPRARSKSAGTGDTKQTSKKGRPPHIASGGTGESSSTVITVEPLQPIAERGLRPTSREFWRLKKKEEVLSEIKKLDAFKEMKKEDQDKIDELQKNDLLQFLYKQLKI
jgi:hypothetical protein